MAEPATPGPAMPEPAMPPPAAPEAAPELLRVEELHAWYGQSHVLHGIDFAVGRRRGGEPCSAATAPARPPPCARSWGFCRGAGGGSPFAAASSSVSPRTGSPGSASATAPRNAASSRASTSRRICCCRRWSSRAASASARSTGLSQFGRAAAQPGHQAFRRRTADAGDRAHPAHRRYPAAARRADRGAGAGHRPADRPGHRRLEAPGLHDPPGRAEFSFRGERSPTAIISSRTAASST